MRPHHGRMSRGSAHVAHRPHVDQQRMQLYPAAVMQQQLLRTRRLRRLMNDDANRAEVGERRLGGHREVGGA